MIKNLIGKWNRLPVANCGNYTIHLHIREQKTGWRVYNTPYEAYLKKTQTGGYDNGPWPADDGKCVPLGHIEAVMAYENLSFEEALRTQFLRVKSVKNIEFEAMRKDLLSCVQNVHSLVKQEIAVLNSEELFTLARHLKIDTDELDHRS